MKNTLALTPPPTASGWIPIFKGGKQMDSAGREHDGDELINNAVKTFNAAEHEPPAVIGHPADNAPAWGWVQELKREGDMLMARFKDLAPEFKDMVNKGMFKKRSASFYPDGRLRHVGFLGAMPPAVKGLPDVAFKENAGMVFEFQDGADDDDFKWPALGTILTNLRELIIEKFGKNTADQVVGRDQIDLINQEPDEIQTVGAGLALPSTGLPDFQDNKESIMTKETVEAPLAATKDTPIPAEFAEKAKADAARIAELEAQLKKEKEEKRKAGIASFVEGLKKEGKYLPAWDKLGMVEFMQTLDETRIEFAEGKKQSSLEFMRGFLTGLPKIVEFKEMSGDGKELPEGDAKREVLIKNFMEENGVSYKKAMLSVAKMHPQLFQ